MKPTIFCHVRKTGGTTLHRVFQKAVGEAQVSPGHGSEPYGNALRRWQELTVISQHVWFSPGETLSKERVNVTVLRNPIDRSLSNYFYIKAQENVFNPDALERRLSLSEFASSQLGYVKAEMENHQAKLFAPIALSAGESSPSADRLLEAAKIALEQFEIVGITERLEETVDLIRWFTGMKAVTVIPRERATDSRPQLAEIPTEIVRRLKELNQFDEELYAYAANRFRTLMRRSYATLLDLRDATSATERDAAGTKSVTGIEAPHGAPRSAGVERSMSRSSGRFGTGEVRIESVKLRGSVSLGAPVFISGEYLTVRIRCYSKIDVEDVTTGLHIHDDEGRLIFGTNSWHLGKSVSGARNSAFEVVFRFQITIGTGRYRIGATLHTGNSHLDRCFDWYDDCASFGVVGVSGFHFDGLVSLVPSVEIQSDDHRARLVDIDRSRRGFIALARHNTPIRKPDGSVRSIVKELTLREGDVFAIELEMVNEGAIPWEEQGRRCVKLCYRWFGENGVVLVEEGERNNLGGDLLPGERRLVWMTVNAPLGYVGPATLRVTLLQEHVAWFDQLGRLYCEIPARISSGGSIVEQQPTAANAQESPTSIMALGRPAS